MRTLLLQLEALVATHLCVCVCVSDILKTTSGRQVWSLTVTGFLLSGPYRDSLMNLRTGRRYLQYIYIFSKFFLRFFFLPSSRVVLVFFFARWACAACTCPQTHRIQKSGSLNLGCPKSRLRSFLLRNLINISRAGHVQEREKEGT